MTGAGARLTAGLQLKLTQTPLACTRVNELTKYIRKASHNTKLSHCSLIYQFKKSQGYNRLIQLQLKLPVAVTLSVMWNWKNEIWDTGWSSGGI